MSFSTRRWCLAVCLAGLCAGAPGAERFVQEARFLPDKRASEAPAQVMLCAKAAVPPVIDGKLDDAAWRRALLLKDFYLLSGAERIKKSTVRTEVRLTYDDRYVYVGARCYDANAMNLKVPYHQKKTINWYNSIELFLDANFDRKSYYQVVLDWQGKVWSAHYQAAGKADTSWKPPVVSVGRCAADAWVVEAALPISSFDGLKRLDQRSWGVNVGRNQQTISGEGNTSTCGVFHGPERYDRVLFTPPGAVAPTALSFGEAVWGRNVARGTLANPSARGLDVLAEVVWQGSRSGSTTRVRVPAGGAAPFEAAFEAPLAWIGKPEAPNAVTLLLRDAKTKRVLGRSSGLFLPSPALTLRLDRERYHVNDLDGQGVMDVNLSADKLAAAEVRLDVLDEDAVGAVTRSQTLRPLTARRAFLGVETGSLPGGRYRAVARLLVAGKEVARAETPFRKELGRRNEPKAARVPIVVRPSQAPGGTWPVTMGVPFPNGALRDGAHVRLLDPLGRETPCQFRVTARWTPKGYVRWLLLDFTARTDAKRETRYQLEYGTSVTRKRAASGLTVGDGARSVTVTTGPLRFVIPKDRFRFIESAWLDANGNGAFEADERVVAPGKGGGAYFVDQRGVRHDSANAKPETFEIEDLGPRRVSIKVTGWHATPDGKQRLGRYVTRVHAYAGCPFLRVFHTFIITADSKKVRYRDIGLSTPLAGAKRYALGLGAGKLHETGEPVSLVQDQWDHFFVRGSGPKVEGKHGSGLARAVGARAGLTVSVRDFWQNYPKELELADGRLTVHFWPAHNSPAKHSTATTDRFDIHMLYFAHEGKELNFAFPPDYRKKFTIKRRPEFDYVNSASRHANAMGVGKTHEMLYLFHPAAADARRLEATADTFQKGVPCMAPPEWVCATAAFDGSMPMHPRDPKRFPEVEEFISGVFDWERRVQKSTNDYGMWVWGDAHDTWDPADKHWIVHRTWINTHHGSPRVPWLLYARSGDPKYLAYARRKAYRCLDIGFCHYSTRDFEGITYPAQKIKGALCDYKGLVPWNSGGRLFDYNCMSDFMLYLYYVTGDRRGLDVLKEWTDAALERFSRPATGRGGSGPLTALLAAYQHTWDPRLLRLIDSYATAKLGSQRPDGAIGGWSQYAPWLSRLHSFTGRRDAEACLEKWCDWYVKRMDAPSRRYGYHFWTPAYGYHVFKREKYLASRGAKLRTMLDATYHKPGGFYDGFWSPHPSVMNGYAVQELPFYLHGLADVGRPVKPVYFATQSLNLSRGTYRLIALDETDRAFRFRCEGVRLYGPMEFSLADPDGVVLKQGKIVSKKPVDFEIAVPGDGKKGEYTLTLKIVRSAALRIPMSDLPKEVFDTGSQYITLVYGSHFCFYAPKDCAAGCVDLERSSCPTAICLYDGRDRPVLRESWLDTKRRVVPVNFKPKPDQRGQVWVVHNGHKVKRLRVRVRKPLPPYISLRREQFFLPGGK